MRYGTGIIVAAAAAAALLAGCTKEDAARFEGDYSFKTSGTLTLTPAVEGTGQPATVRLIPESGQMNIIKKDKSRTSMTLTMNILGGDAVVFENVNAEGRVLSILVPYPERQVAIKTPAGTGIADMTVSGTAQKFTDVILFDLSCTGTALIDGVAYQITDSDIDCIAQEND